MERGAYNHNSRVQAAGLVSASDWFRDAAERVALPAAPAPITIADYGVSQGHNSMAPLAGAMDALRRRAGGARAITVFHTDLPDNDFGALFHTLSEDPSSYLRGRPDVYPAAVGRSFYSQILPAGSVTLGWSSWSVQWLSRTPGPIPDQVQVFYSADSVARAAYAAQAAADWRAFLIARSAELAPGGRLVVLTMALDEAQGFGYRPLLEELWQALQDCQRSGLIEAAEAAAMAIPTVGRSQEDMLAPFAATGGFAGLSVEAAEVFLAEDRIWRDFQTDLDAAAFGARWAAFSRASVFPTLAAALTGAAGRRVAFSDHLASDLAARLAAAPQQMAIPLARISLVRDRGSAGGR